jgi:alkanesulfonate monooxygenase SsuD/methylene tetrahydromethanopterin reductase-like flavin-dependent oxidoreductase (luciferase family)
MDPEPRPRQRPIPVLVGGHSDAAIDRAARLGDGWIAADVSPDRLAELLPKLHEAADRHGRDPASVPVYCGTGRRAVTLDVVRAYEALGVRSLQVFVDDLAGLTRLGDEIVPALT